MTFCHIIQQEIRPNIISSTVITLGVYTRCCMTETLPVIKCLGRHVNLSAGLHQLTVLVKPSTCCSARHRISFRHPMATK